MKTEDSKCYRNSQKRNIKNQIVEKRYLLNKLLEYENGNLSDNKRIIEVSMELDELIIKSLERRK